MADLLERVDENGPAFEHEGILYETYTSIGEKTLRLTQMTVDRYRESGQKITKLAIIPKGGNLLGSILPERLGLDNDQIIYFPVQSYKGRTQALKGKLTISPYMPRREEIEDENFLVTEEVWETGHTIHFAKRYLDILGAASVCVATLYDKPDKNEIEGGQPDISVAKTNLWIDFPWERERRLMQPATDVSARTYKRLVIDPDVYLEDLRRRQAA